MPLTLTIERSQLNAEVLETGERGVPLEEMVVYLEEGSAPERVGKMWWRIDTGEVIHLWVKRNYRRRGIATQMWQIARAEGARHSEFRTKEGNAWAESLGEDLPKWRLA